MYVYIAMYPHNNYVESIYLPCFNCFISAGTVTAKSVTTKVDTYSGRTALDDQLINI